MSLLRLKKGLLWPLLVVLTACDAAGGGSTDATSPEAAASPHEVTGYYFNSADVLVYLHPVRMFEERGMYERTDGSLEVQHADIHNLVIRLHPLVLSDDKESVKQEIVDQALLYGILKVFTHTEVEWLDLTVSPLATTAERDQAKPKATYLAHPKRHVALSRAQAQAFLRAHSTARSFSDLVDTDKNWHHLRGADSLIYTDLYYTPGKASQLAQILSRQYGVK